MSYQRAADRPDGTALVSWLRKAPKETTLVRFSDGKKDTPSDRIWLPGQYARHSMEVAVLSQVFFGTNPTAVQKLDTTLNRWFDVRRRKEEEWALIPAPPRAVSSSCIYVDNTQLFEVSVGVKGTHKPVKLSLTGTRHGEGADISLTVHNTQLLASSMHAYSEYLLKEKQYTLECRTSMDGATVAIRQSQRPRGCTITLSRFDAFALRNRLLAVVARSA